MQTKAYLLGKQSFSAEVHPACPYSYETQDYYDWWEGWDDGESAWMDEHGE